MAQARWVRRVPLSTLDWVVFVAGGALVLVLGDMGAIPFYVAGVAARALMTGSQRQRHVGQSDRRTGRQVLELELDRARRSARPLALVRVPVDGASPHSTVQDLGFSRQLRAMDVVWQEGRDCYLLLPETDANTANCMLSRVSSGTPVLGAPAIAVFPHDALTSGALLEAVRGRTGRQRSPDSGVAPETQDKRELDQTA